MRVKRNQKDQAGIYRSLPPTYLEEFVWRQDYIYTYQYDMYFFS